MSELTFERARELFDYDPDTGVISWRQRTKSRRIQGAEAGSLKTSGYLVVGIDSKVYLAHRVAWLIVYGSWPNDTIDHINGVRSDNRLENLRDVSRKSNVENQRGPNADNKSGFLGVRWHKRGKKFYAAIKTNRKCIHLGGYTTPEEAHQAYITAKRQLHAGNTL